MTIKIIAALATIVAFAACTDTSTMTAPSATEADFGNSVDSLIKAQTADPATLSNPSTTPVTGVEPDYAGNVVKAMRESAAKPAEVKQPIEIRVGSQ
jgi:ABC-type amino acid transport substrate-binding protein